MKNCGKFTAKYLCRSLILMKFQALKSATLLQSDSSRDFFMWILSLKNTYLRTATSESVRYKMYILLSECRLEEEKECKTEDNPWMNLWATILQLITNIRDASIPKLNLATEIFHVDSFVILFSSFFLLGGDLKIDLMFFIQLIWWIRTRQIFKKIDQT